MAGGASLFRIRSVLLYSATSEPMTVKIAYLDCRQRHQRRHDAGGPGRCRRRAGRDSGRHRLAWVCPNIKLIGEEVKKQGFRATQVKVEHEPEHAHRHLHHITKKIDASGAHAAAEGPGQADLHQLGEAEAKVHGTTIRKVHFHEVGAVDSIADIVGAAVGLDLLGVDRIVCSPVPTGTATSRSRTAACSVPAPATAELLKGVPLAASSSQFELTTPTGAAIVDDRRRRVRPAAGDDDRDDRLRRRRPRSEGAAEHAAADRRRERPTRLASDQVWVLETNLDDISGEIIGHCHRAGCSRPGHWTSTRPPSR